MNFYILPGYIYVEEILLNQLNMHIPNQFLIILPVVSQDYGYYMVPEMLLMYNLSSWRLLYLYDISHVCKECIQGKLFCTQNQVKKVGKLHSNLLFHVRKFEEFDCKINQLIFLGTPEQM